MSNEGWDPIPTDGAESPCFLTESGVNETPSLPSQEELRVLSQAILMTVQGSASPSPCLSLSFPVVT